jgi:hypothetical protein
MRNESTLVFKSIPVVLFAYARPDHLRRVLACLRENSIPLLYVFADGPKTPEVAQRVNDVRQILHEIDWCEVHLVERAENLGLGKSILAGVTEVFQKHEAIIVFEDDLVCVPGTYQYMCAVLEHYKDDLRVMSITGRTHPRVTPSTVTNQPYFDGRAECLVWGTWARVWQGMEIDAKTLMEQCKDQGIDIYRYGADLVDTAKAELRLNIWAVRLLYLHILNKKLCLRPPWSMVEHIGWDSQGTNAKEAGIWEVPPLKPCPPIPTQWPEPVEHPECPGLWRKQYGEKPSISQRILGPLVRYIRHSLPVRAVKYIFRRV